MLKCSMVILNYRDSKRAMNLALRCSKYECVDRIVLVDNCSGDGSYEFLKEIKHEKIDVIQTQKNGGFAYGNNYGIRYIIEKYNSKYILCANTDTLFENEQIKECINSLEKHSDVGLVSTRMKDINGVEEKSNWNFLTYSYAIKNAFWSFRRKKYNDMLKHVYNNDFEIVDVVRGSFMMFRAKAIKKASFFDEATFLYGEELIISKRLLQAGYKTGLVTNLYYTHNHVYFKSTIDTEVKTFSDILKSEMYFLKQYCNVKGIKLKILKCFDKFSALEWRIILNLKEIKSKHSQKSVGK